MGTFRTFEDIEAWQLAREFAKDIYRMTQSVENSGNKDIIYQINRSSGSVMDNIAEGFGRRGNKVGGKTAGLYNYLKTSNRKGSKFEEPQITYSEKQTLENIKPSTINFEH